MIEVAGYTDMVKVGGAVLGVEGDNGQPIRQNDETFAALGEEVAASPNDVVLATSFAIARGMIETETAVRPDPDTEEGMAELQALAAVGQPLVHQTWNESIPGNRSAAQILLTRQELGEQARVREILRTIGVLLTGDHVPVVNENDAISHEEIKFGSNDILSAMLAIAMQRSERFGQVRFFMLTDVNGVHKDPKNPNTRIPVVEDPMKYMHLATDPRSKFSIGGMRSKLEAAHMARMAGIPTYIYNPADGPREVAVEGEIGTYIPVWRVHNPSR
jgi:glutamate 5-kinase